MTYNEIIHAIERGEINDEWINHDSAAVRMTLAEHDYKPEILIHDENYYVVKEVLERHPDMVTELLGKKDRIRMVGCFLDGQKHIPLNVLKQHLEDVDRYEIYSDSPVTELEVKLKAMEYEPSLMEVTMTTKQLYESGSPLWAKDMSPRAIYKLISEQKSEKTLKSLLPQGQKPQPQEKTLSEKTLKSLLPQGQTPQPQESNPVKEKTLKPKQSLQGAGPFKEPCQKRR